MQKQGVIKPSSSAWASPIVLVPKKDGSARFCVDHRRLNAVTKKDVYPLPRIDDILDTLGTAKYFTSLDVASGYWQIEIDPAILSLKQLSQLIVASMSSAECLLVFATHPQRLNDLCR